MTENSAVFIIESKIEMLRQSLAKEKEYSKLLEDKLFDMSTTLHHQSVEIDQLKNKK